MIRRTRSASHPGTVLPTLGVCLIGLFAFVGLAVDLGVLALARTQSQNAADDAALVGVRNLNNKVGAIDTNRAAALTAAQNAAKSNPLLNTNFVDAQIQTVRAGLYAYNSTNGYFSVSYPNSLAAGQSWTAMNVQLAATQPTYFMRVMGVTSMPTGANATAVHRPRDVAVVLDFSVSMRFGSMSGWEPGNGNSNGETRGYLNPDPRYPQFGHYARYTRYQTNSLPDYGPAGGTQVANPQTFCTQSTVANRPNPLCIQVPYVMQTGEVATPNNHTMDSPNGPPVVTGAQQTSGPGWSGGFWYDPANPAQNGVTPANLKNAFLQWSPSITTAGNSTTYTPNQYDWSTYSATTAALPAPDFFKDQIPTSGGVNYVGDMWPNADGSKGGPFTETSGTRTAAATLAEFLGIGTFASGASPPLTGNAGIASLSGILPVLTRWDSYRNQTWETYGYDLKVPTWKGASYLTVTPGNATTYVQQAASGNLFQGYSMGPMYWGKTFFIWPPDPRFDPSLNPKTDLTSPDPARLSYTSSGKAMCDWRKRFFLKVSGGSTVAFSSSDNINQLLFRNGVGYTLADGAENGTTVVPNYPAILAWLKSGPQVFPSNLRAGRILYYTSIPSTVANASSNTDQRFWKDYIDFVLGQSNYDPKYNLAGVEYAPWPEGATVGVSQGTLSGVAGTANPGPPTPPPPPYMNYTDNPSRPRMDFWFGPATFLDFISSRSSGRKWWAGTVHEAQDWQLKAGINSALDDIRANHPNDQCGLAYFANFAFSTVRCPMGQDYTSLKSALFYPGSLVSKIKGGDTTTELLPYDSNFNSTLTGDLPNANGGTDPVTGLSLAYNLLSSGATHSTLVPPWGTGSTAAATGRRGAAKIVIFETDGVPNAINSPYWSYYKQVNGTTGQNQSYFQNDNSGTYNVTTSGPLSGAPPWDAAGNAAIQVAKQIVAPTTATNPGYSLPNAPARVFGLAYGDLFYYPTARKTFGLQFLYNLQVAGNTSAADGSNTVPSYQIITGPYQTRIDNIRTAMQTIMQSGVQVALIE
ncbi:MAG: hypothetical protein JWO38_6022 [Gemmataceae bacterium]|nr:hypothetical protein [Gemmataceae bacterium]